jgi:chemotaxis protein MotB
MALIEEDGGVEGAPAWITTFVDMISLLVTFFILLFTFSSLEEYDSFTFKENILGTRGTIESEGGSSAVPPPPDDIMSAMDVARGASAPHARPADQLPESLEEMGQRLTERHIEFDARDVADGLVVRFGPEASFGPGSTEVTDELRRGLVELARVMQHYPHLLVVEGFTDSEFKPSPSHPTAAALSCARAAAAVEVMLASSELPATRVQISGLGSARPRASNESATERTLNRRVEVRILAQHTSAPRAEER